MSDAFPISNGAALSQAQHASKTQQGQQSNGASQGAMSAQDTDSAQGNTASSNGKNNDKDVQNKHFPSVFQALMQDGDADASKQAAAMDPTQLLAAKKGDKTAAANDKDAAGDPAMIAGLPMFAAEAGKGLPQMNWSGYAAVADNQGASALAMQGDQNKLLSSQIVNGKDLPNAVLKAQEQIASAQLQQGNTPSTNGGDVTGMLNKQNLPGLQLAHQFLADNASLSQTHTVNTASVNNSQHVIGSEFSNLLGAAGARTDNNSLPQISVPVQTPQWGQQLGDRVQWMVGQNLQQASIHLNPPELGSLDVHIQLHGDQTNVNFSSPHAVVRHALDAAIPRLREMMHETGLTLGDVNVSGQALAQHQQPRDSQSQQSPRGYQGGGGRSEEPQAIVATSSVRHLRPNSMLDVYA